MPLVVLLPLASILVLLVSVFCITVVFILICQAVVAMRMRSKKLFSVRCITVPWSVKFQHCHIIWLTYSICLCMPVHADQGAHVDLELSLQCYRGSIVVVRRPCF